MAAKVTEFKEVTAKKSPRDGFTMVWNAFLDNEELNQYEKLVFIAIKSFADNKTNKAFPSLTTISRVTGTSISQVRRSIAHMEELGILTIEHRRSKELGNMKNLYTLRDSKQFWMDAAASNEDNDLEAVTEELPDDKLIAELRKRGYEITKKELTTETRQSSEVSPLNVHYSNNNNSTNDNHRQEVYRKTHIEFYFDYDEMVEDYPEKKKEIDYIIQILYDTLNSESETIRVQRTNRPKDVVIGQLMKLKSFDIIYVIDKYNQQKGRIENPRAYILTQLYEAVGQHNADLTNMYVSEMNKEET